MHLRSLSTRVWPKSPHLVWPLAPRAACWGVKLQNQNRIPPDFSVGAEPSEPRWARRSSPNRNCSFLEDDYVVAWEPETLWLDLNRGQHTSHWGPIQGSDPGFWIRTHCTFWGHLLCGRQLFIGDRGDITPMSPATAARFISKWAWKCNHHDPADEPSWFRPRSSLSMVVIGPNVIEMTLKWPELNCKRD